MDRYICTPHTLACEAEGWDHTDEWVEHTETFEGYAIYDTVRGTTEGAWAAFSRDPDTAQRIVDLLNADERLRMQAQMKGSPSDG